MPDLNKRHKDYLDLEIERQKAKSQRMREEWEEKKKREAEDQTVPISSKSTSHLLSTLYLPSPEAMAEYEREQQEKERQMAEEDKRAQMMNRFDFRAAFFAFIWVGLLTIIGIIVAKCFTDFFEDFSEPGPWVLVFIVSTWRVGHIPANKSLNETKPHNINLLCGFLVPKNDDSGPSSDRKKTEQDTHWWQICYTKIERWQM